VPPSDPAASRPSGSPRFTPVRFSTAPTRAQWIAQTATLGRKDAARIAPRDQVEASVGA